MIQDYMTENFIMIKDTTTTEKNSTTNQDFMMEKDIITDLMEKDYITEMPYTTEKNIIPNMKFTTEKKKTKLSLMLKISLMSTGWL